MTSRRECTWHLFILQHPAPQDGSNSELQQKEHLEFPANLTIWIFGIIYLAMTCGNSFGYLYTRGLGCSRNPHAAWLTEATRPRWTATAKEELMGMKNKESLWPYLMGVRWCAWCINIGKHPEDPPGRRKVMTNATQLRCCRGKNTTNPRSSMSFSFSSGNPKKHKRDLHQAKWTLVPKILLSCV